MRKLLLYLTVLILHGKATSQNYSFIQLSNAPVKITSQSVVVNPKESGGAREVTKCTVTFWLHFNPKSVTNEFHLLSIRNRAIPKAIGSRFTSSTNTTVVADSDTSQCPYRREDILEDPTVIEQMDFKLNPHCKHLESLLSELTDHPKEILSFKVTRIDSKLELVVSYPQGSAGAGKPAERGTDEFKLIDDHSDNWFFIVFSIDFKEGKGNSFLQLINYNMQQHKRRFNFVHLDHSFAKDFYFLFSDNHRNISDKSSIKGMMYKPKFYPECFEHAELLLLANQESRLTTEDLLLLDVSFTGQPSSPQPNEKLPTHAEESPSVIHKPLDQRQRSNVSSKKRRNSTDNYNALAALQIPSEQAKNGKYSFLIKNKEYPNAFVENLSMETNFEIAISKLLEKEETEKFFFVQSPSFLFEVELLNPRMEQVPIFRFLNETTGINITLSITRYQQDEITYCKFAIAAAASLNDTFTYITPSYEIPGQTVIMTFSFVNFLNKFMKFTLLVNQKYSFISQNLSGVNLDVAQLNLRLHPFESTDNVRIYRLAFLKTLDGPASSMLLNPVKSELACRIPVSFFGKNGDDCLKCGSLSVRNPIGNDCAEHCPSNTRNVLGTCWPCDGKCDAAGNSFIQITRAGNTKFYFTLSREIYDHQNLNPKDILSVNLQDRQGQVKSDFQGVFVSGKVIMVEVDPERSLYGAILTVKLQSQAENKIYDMDRNFLESYVVTKKVNSIRKLSPKSTIITSVLAYLMGALFYITLIIAIIFFLLSMKLNLNSFACKKFILNIQMLQLIPFMLFLNISYPSNLHGFLSKAYGLIIELSMLKIENEHSNESFIEEYALDNMAGNHVTPDFLKNIGILFAFHCGVLIIYTVLALINCFFKFLPVYAKKFFDGFRNFFELNILMMTLILFDHEILVFAIVSVTSTSGNHHPTSKFSLIFSLIYLAIYMVSGIAYFMLLFCKLIKPKLHEKYRHIFIEKTHMYFENTNEIFQITSHFIFAIILVLLRKQPLIQLMTFLGLHVVLYFIAGLLLTFEHRIDFVFEMISRFIFLCIVLVFILFALEDESEFFAIETREIIGWIAIGLIGLLVIFNYIVDFVHLWLFFKQQRAAHKNSGNLNPRLSHETKVTFDVHQSQHQSILESYISGGQSEIANDKLGLQQSHMKYSSAKRLIKGRKEHLRELCLENSQQMTPEKDQTKSEFGMVNRIIMNSNDCQRKIGLQAILAREKYSSTKKSALNHQSDVSLSQYQSGDNDSHNFSFRSDSQYYADLEFKNDKRSD